MTDEYIDLPECGVCLSPIEDAWSKRTKYHTDCGKVYRKHYHRIRLRAINKFNRFLKPEELEDIRRIAARKAAEEIALELEQPPTP